MRLNTNISAIRANNSLQRAESKLSKSIQRLSSGYKITNSADNAAGYAITEKMRLQIKGLSQASNNTSDGTSVLYTAEGAIEEIQSMILRMKELTVQAGDGAYTAEDRASLQDEINALNSEIDRISHSTEFNSQILVDGSLSRRTYSNYESVKQTQLSENIATGDYGITITQDARQAVAVGDGNITMTATAAITAAQAGTISVNGYSVEVKEGDTLSGIVGKLSTAAGTIRAKLFVVDGSVPVPDTKNNGSDYAGYIPVTGLTGNRIVAMTDDFGASESMRITCDNNELADLLGISSATAVDGLYAEGSDVKAEFTVDADGNRIGFADSAVMSSDGNSVTVRDVNNKEFTIEVTGGIAGTVFSDVAKDNYKPTVVSDSTANIVQQVTDAGTMSVHVGANKDQVVIIDIPEITSESIGTSKINVMTSELAAKACKRVDDAVNYVNKVRSKIGSYENRLEHTSNNLATEDENLNRAVSSLADADMAVEMTEYTTLTVMTQAATSILAQANERPSNVLQLLQ